MKRGINKEVNYSIGKKLASKVTIIILIRVEMQDWGNSNMLLQFNE